MDFSIRQCIGFLALQMWCFGVCGEASPATHDHSWGFGSMLSVVFLR